MILASMFLGRSEATRNLALFTTGSGPFRSAQGEHCDLLSIEDFLHPGFSELGGRSAGKGRGRRDGGAEAQGSKGAGVQGRHLSLSPWERVG